jgi:large subunit ribosomal protein L21
VVWTPYVEGAKVRVKILAHQQGDKMHIVKIQNKKRYRRKIGFRSQQTILLIEKITS